MDIRDVLTLSDGNEYVIASKVNYDYKIYLYLVDINNNKNIKFCYLDNDEVVIVKKENLSSSLVLKLLNQMIKEFKEDKDNK